MPFSVSSGLVNPWGLLWDNLGVGWGFLRDNQTQALKVNSFQSQTNPKSIHHLTKPNPWVIHQSSPYPSLSRRIWSHSINLLLHRADALPVLLNNEHGDGPTEKVSFSKKVTSWLITFFLDTAHQWVFFFIISIIHHWRVPLPQNHQVLMRFL